MNCVFCEAPVTPGMRYCPHCGTFLNSPEAGKPYTPFKTHMGGRPPRYASPMPQNSTAALVSLIAGILSWTLIPVIPAFVAIVAGHQARREIRESGGRVTGDSMALIGLILGYPQVVLVALGIAGILAMILGGLVFGLS